MDSIADSGKASRWSNWGTLKSIWLSSYGDITARLEGAIVPLKSVDESASTMISNTTLRAEFESYNSCFVKPLPTKSLKFISTEQTLTGGDAPRILTILILASFF